MSNIFLCSDHHLEHANILTFLNSDGTKLRDFAHIDEMNEHIIKQHNSVVSSKDKVYFLGDVVMNKKGFHLLSRMNGEKVLIKGNHDIHKLDYYTQFFKDIRGCHQFDGMFLSHVPIHPESLSRWKVNVHGHLHANRVKNPYGQPDERYQNVSMEQLDDYTPISLEQMKSRLKNLGLI